MRKLLMCLALMTVAISAFGQGVRTDLSITQTASNAPVGASANVMTVPNAIVTMCAYPATGSPCTNTVPLFSDLGLTQPLPSNPVTADAKGRVGWFVAPGIYSYTVQTQSGVVVGQYTLNDNTIGILAAPSTSQTVTQPTGTNLNIIGTLEHNGLPIGNSKTFYGSLFNASTFTSISAFTPNGTTPAISEGALVFSGGVSGFGQSLDLNQFTTLPQWSISATYAVGAITGSSQGIGFGIRSYESSLNAVGSLNTQTGANQGFLFLYAGTANSATSATALSFSAGDSIQITMTRQFDTITFTASDLTTKSAAISVSYQYQFAYPQANILPNRGRFAVFNFGGTQTLTSLSISSAAPIGADLLCVGDSKTVSYYAGSYLNGYCQQLQRQMLAVNESGGSDTTADVLAVVPEIIALKPKAVLLNIGRNDIGAGVPFSTYSANYASIVSQLQAAGITVYHLLPIYETVVNQAPLTAFIQATYPAANIFDAGLQNYAGVLSPDGIHPTPLGEGYITNAALAFFSNLGFNSSYFNYSASLTNCYSQTIGVASFGCPQYRFGINQSQLTTTAYQQVGTLAQTNDAANPFSLNVFLTGNATASLRQYTLQTQQIGSGNSGVLALQPLGGNLFLGGNPTLIGITGVQQCLQVNTFGVMSGIGQPCGAIPFATPATSSAACTVPQFSYDAAYLYTCVATNTWRRIASVSF